jgi:DNA polymerase-3 subunit chi
VGDVLFYHLTRSRLAAAAGQVLEKCMDRGWRVAVRGTDPEALAALDDALWLGPGEGFLPHGRAGGPHDARQPILLTVAAGAPNRPDCLMAVDGAAVTPADVAAHARTCIFFDGTDGDQVAGAREQWRTLTRAGAEAQYWSEESGRWDMKARAGP